MWKRETMSFLFLCFVPAMPITPRLPVSSFLQRRRYTSINEHQRNAYQIYLLADKYLIRVDNHKVCGLGRGQWLRQSYDSGDNDFKVL